VSKTISSGRTILRTTATVAALATAMLLAAEAQANGGLSTGDDGATQSNTVAGDKAKLVKGKAIPPENAPTRIKKVIRAANKIRNKPYKWGGGHGSWEDSGYDCSGAVSYALRGGNLLKTPLDSRGLARWKQKGKGKWLTVFGANSHAYMVVAGLRFDTAMVKGNGPRWSKKLRSTPESYKKRRARKL
jgi:cell wall-associated NlpC family hydrolase